MQDEDTERSHGRVKEEKMSFSHRYFFTCLRVFLCGYVPPDLELVFVTAPVLSVKESKKNGNFRSCFPSGFVASRLSFGAETPAGALEEEQLGNRNEILMPDKIMSLRVPQLW